MTMKRLMDLGAPKLPEGHFYRVRSNVYGVGFVQVRRKRLLGSRLLTEKVVPTTAVDDDDRDVPVSPEDGIAYAARKAVEAMKEELERLDYWARFRALEGDHRHDWRTA